MQTTTPTLLQDLPHHLQASLTAPGFGHVTCLLGTGRSFPVIVDPFLQQSLQAPRPSSLQILQLRAGPLRGQLGPCHSLPVRKLPQKTELWDSTRKKSLKPHGVKQRPTGWGWGPRGQARGKHGPRKSVGAKTWLPEVVQKNREAFEAGQPKEFLMLFPLGPPTGAGALQLAVHEHRRTKAREALLQSLPDLLLVGLLALKVQCLPVPSPLHRSLD